MLGALQGNLSREQKSSKIRRLGIFFSVPYSELTYQQVSQTLVLILDTALLAMAWGLLTLDIPPIPPDTLAGLCLALSLSSTSPGLSSASGQSEGGLGAGLPRTQSAVQSLAKSLVTTSNTPPCVPSLLSSVDSSNDGSPSSSNSSGRKFTEEVVMHYLFAPTGSVLDAVGVTLQVP